LKAAGLENFEIGKVEAVKKLRDPKTKRVYGFEDIDGKVATVRQQE
jgi:hypothetical protein